MAAVVIRNLPDSVHQAIKRRAQEHGRSTEAEIREILIRSTGEIGKRRGMLGSELHELWKSTGSWDLHLPPRADPVRIIDFTAPEFWDPSDDNP